MKTCAILVSVIIMSAVVSSYAETEVSINFRSLAPAESLDWDSASGAGLQLRFWKSPRAALAASVGFESWRAVEEYVEVSDDSGSISSYISGDASVVPVGLSMLYRFGVDDAGSTVKENGGVSLLFEAGIRYAFVNSAIYSEATVDENGRISSYADTIAIDDAWLILLGVTLEVRLAKDFALEFGLAYQMDLSNPGETWLNESIGNTGFEGFAAHMGIAVKF